MKLEKVLSFLKITKEYDRKKALGSLEDLNTLLKSASLENLVLKEEEYKNLKNTLRTQNIVFSKEPSGYAERTKGAFTYEKYKALLAFASESEFAKFEKFVKVIGEILFLERSNDSVEEWRGIIVKSFAEFNKCLIENGYEYLLLSKQDYEEINKQLKSYEEVYHVKHSENFEMPLEQFGSSTGDSPNVLEDSDDLDD